jgi:acyl-CoA synthetase (NDP forming)
MPPVDISKYRPVFYPESLAVIGASDSPRKFGGNFLRTNLEYGYQGRVYPVNPKGGTIQGMKAYAKVSDIPDPVDFAAITVPAPLVLEAVKDCVRKGVKGAEILSAGFRESGPQGDALEAEVVRVAREGGLRLVGPNCFGVHTPAAGLTLLPGIDFSTTPGPIGFFSQSGGGTCEVVYMARGRNLYFSVVVSYGNSCDIDAAEMLRYFEADPKTRIVGAYIEGVKDGRAFFNALASCAAKKPVVVMKGGLSEQGFRGTIGHTGSMAGTRQAWTAAIKSAGAVPAAHVLDLTECLMAFNCLPDFSGGGAGIMGGGGAAVVAGLDAAGAEGFSVPVIDEQTAARIQAYLPPAGGRAGNPVDLANPGNLPTVINPIMEILAEQKDVDFLVIFEMLFFMLNQARRAALETGQEVDTLAIHRQIADKAREVREKTGQPLAAVLIDIASDPAHWPMELGRIQARHLYTANGIPCFDDGYQTFSVLRRVADYYRRRKAALAAQG